MNTNTTTEQFESTYALIVRSEERERGFSEAAVYVLLILSVVFSIWQVALQPVRVPTSILLRSAPVAQSGELPEPRNV